MSSALRRRYTRFGAARKTTSFVWCISDSGAPKEGNQMNRKQRNRYLLKRIVAGVLHDGLNVDRLTPEARKEMCSAIEAILELAKDENE